jgi:hypothetical protein
MYLIGIGALTFLYFYNKFNDINYTPKKKYTVRYVPNDKLYFYCDHIVKFYSKKELELCLKKQKNMLEFKNNWTDKIEKLNYEFIYKNWQSKMNKVINQVKDSIDKNYCIWVYRNEINNLKQNKIVILDLNSIYDYSKNEFLNLNYFKFLSKFCHLHKIIFVVITELHPSVVEKFNIKYLNKNNITTPFNFRVKTFGGIVRLKENELSEKPAEITINKIIIDIFNRYGSNYNETIYIGVSGIPKVKCLLLNN